jgi:hypothetical protein
MNCSDGTWRMESYKPLTSGRPMPSAWQDTFMMTWDANLLKFVLVPRGHTGYSHNVLAYTTGFWTYDPLNADPVFGGSFGTWAQDTRLFNTTTGTQGAEFQMSSGTGAAWGGVYDPTTRIVYVIKDNPVADGPGVGRYNLATATRLGNASYPISGLLPNLSAGGRSPLSTETGGCRVNRNAYWLAKTSDSELGLVRMNLDTLQFTRLANVPIHSRQLYIPMGEATTRLVACGSTHLVYVANGGPEGSIHAIYVYNIAADRWAVDTQIPFIDRFSPASSGGVRYAGGCVGEGPNNSVAICGTALSNNSASSTHMIFYTPTGVA